MNVAVRYYTRSGNTEKLAKGIAEAIGVTAANVAVPLEERADILFLGCSYYAFDVDPNVKKYICDNKQKIEKIVCFGTSAMMKSVYKPMKKVAEEYGVEIEKEDFHCHGSFGPMHKGRPNAEDISKAQQFAKRILSQ
ncbi:MAG: flavodoxin [Lachnospiraceae bacterium]|nr:flavodoxin [Lachnospiraceae bacterium]